MIKILQLLYLLLSGRFHVLGRDVPLQVNGLINQSVNLSNYLTLTHPVRRVIWEFIRNGTSVEIAEYRDLTLEIPNINFTGRLEAYNTGTTIRIKRLRMGDSGIFTAQIVLTNLEKKEPSFNLTIYEPVPAPSIRTELRGNTTDWCNFTLQCAVPENTSMVSFGWKYRDKALDFQHYGYGRTVHESLRPESWNTEFLCLLHNPADQKNVTFQPLEICPTRGETQLKGIRRYWITPTVISLVLFIMLLLLFILKRKKRKKRIEHPTTPARDSRDIQLEVQYIEVQASPRVINKEHLCRLQHGPGGPPRQKPETVYTEIQRAVS